MTDAEIIAIRKATRTADVTSPFADSIAFARAVIAAKLHEVMPRADTPTNAPTDAEIDAAMREMWPNAEVDGFDRAIYRAGYRAAQSPAPAQETCPRDGLPCVNVPCDQRDWCAHFVATPAAVSPAQERYPRVTEGLWERRWRRLHAACAIEHGPRDHEPECPICEAMCEQQDAPAAVSDTDIHDVRHPPVPPIPDIKSDPALLAQLKVAAVSDSSPPGACPHGSTSVICSRCDADLIAKHEAAPSDSEKDDLVRAALDRMCRPLDESRLKGVTAQEDARCMKIIRDTIEQQAKRLADPIPMLLFCPACNLQHVDRVRPEKGWDNPPHRSHECQGCGYVWRPSDHATTGAQSLTTCGKADRSPIPQAKAEERLAEVERDAARYRWLKDHMKRDDVVIATYQNGTQVHAWYSPAGMDADISARGAK